MLTALTKHVLDNNKTKQLRRFDDTICRQDAVIGEVNEGSKGLKKTSWHLSRKEVKYQVASLTTASGESDCLPSETVVSPDALGNFFSLFL